jgi:hydrophobe/amphiphile efflux-1 (HAE1) family protein
MARFFVNRPIVAMVLSIILVLIGLVAMRGLPIAQYPEIVPPMVQVTTTFIGASATDVEASVATPLEQKINGVEKGIYMKSTNANDGTLTLKVSFEVGSNQDMDNVFTQNRVSEAMPQMPQSVKNYGVTVKKALPFPLLVISVKSPNGTYDNNFLSNYTTININDTIARIPGVGQINLFGGSDYAMRIWLRPDRIGRLGLTVPDIVNAINSQNQLTPAGQIGGPPAATGTDYTYTVKTQGRLLDEQEFGDIILRTDPDGSQVRIKDVARIELGTMLYNAVGRHDGKPAAVIAVFQIPGTNAVEVASNIKATMEDLKKRFPRDMDYLISLDTTLPVTEGINEIVHTLFEAVALVLLVVFIFLQNWRATLIPLMTVPVSLVGAFIFFPMLGFSINVLSLLGLVLAIGIVVDDAIVVVEAVMHHIEHGMEPKAATIKAMEEVSGPVVAIGLILIAVFVPVGFMGGITGRLYQQFAITIALSVLLSVVNALTLSPALAGMLLKAPTGKKTLLTPFYNGFNKVFGVGTDAYVSFSAILIRKMFRSMAFIGVLIYVIVVLVRQIPGGFVPEEDQGYIMVNAQLPDAASLERTDAAMRKAEAILEKNEAIEGFNTISGYSLLTAAYSSNMAFFFVQLKPWEERSAPEAHAREVVNALNKAFRQEIPEGQVLAFGPPAIPGLGTGAGFTMQLQDRSGGPPRYLADQTQRFLEAARKRPEIGRIATLYRAAVPQVFANIDRSKVLKSGVQLNDVNTTLGALLGSSYINDFNKFGRVYKVYLQAESEFRKDPNQLGLFFVRNQKGGMVPLDTLITTAPASGPEFTNRFNLFRSAELTGVPAAGFSSAQALDALEATAKDVLPGDMSFDWADLSYQERRAPGVAVVFALAVFLVFLVLAAQYESWGMPFSVLLGTPFAAFGAYLGLWLARTFMGESYVNNVFAQIGLIMLIGLAAKNAILIVEFAKMEHDAGKPLVEAALSAARLRLRPILMTAFAFILGVVPLLTATGAGAEARKVMGMVVFSGMLVATILGVLLIPMLYVAVERVIGGEKKADAPVPTLTPAGTVVAGHGQGTHA